MPEMINKFSFYLEMQNTHVEIPSRFGVFAVPAKIIVLFVKEASIIGVQRLSDIHICVKIIGSAEQEIRMYRSDG